MMRSIHLRSVAVACMALAVVACGEATTNQPRAGAAAEAAAELADAQARPGHEAGTVREQTETGAAPISSATTPEAPAKPVVPAKPAMPPAAAAATPELVEERSGVTTNGAFVVSWAPMPDPIPFNEPFRLAVTVARAANHAVPERSARLELDATMPAHGHGMNRTPRVIANGDGTFLVEGMLFHMSGEWNLVFHVYVGAEYGQVILRVELP